MMADDAAIRSRLTNIASSVETLVHSISSDDAERNRIAAAMERISAAKKASNG